MADRWIRLDTGWANSTWLARLHGNVSSCWPRLLCWIKLHGTTGRAKRIDPEVLARHWKVSVEDVAALEVAALEHGAITVEEGYWQVAKWGQYQPTDPTGAARQQKWRGKA